MSIVPGKRITESPVSPADQLTGRIAGAVMSYVLVAKSDESHLPMKIATARGRWIAPLLSVGDLVMARRQLLNLKQLAEQSVEITLA